MIGQRLSVQHRVHVHLLHPPGSLLHQLRIGQPFDPQDLHLDAPLPAHDNTSGTQSPRVNVPAHQRGIGEQRLHKGIFGPLLGGLILGRSHRPLFLGGHRDEQQRTSHLKGTVSLSQGHRSLLQVLGGLGHHRPNPAHCDGLGRIPAQGQGGQGPDHIVIEPLVAHHAVDPVQLHLSPLQQLQRPVLKILRLGKNLLQPLAVGPLGQLRPPGMKGHPHPASSSPACLRRGKRLWGQACLVVRISVCPLLPGFTPPRGFRALARFRRDIYYNV